MLTLVLVLIPLLQRLSSGEMPAFLVMILLITSVAYGFSRTGATQIAGIIAIMALWVLPTFAVLIGYSSTTTFILTVVRLLLLALLFTYLLFSLRVSLLLGWLMVIGFLLIPLLRASPHVANAACLRLSADRRRDIFRLHHHAPVRHQRTPRR